MIRTADMTPCVTTEPNFVSNRRSCNSSTEFLSSAQADCWYANIHGMITAPMFAVTSLANPVSLIGNWTASSRMSCVLGSATNMRTRKTTCIDPRTKPTLSASEYDPLNAKPSKDMHATIAVTDDGTPRSLIADATFAISVTNAMTHDTM